MKAYYSIKSIKQFVIFGTIFSDYGIVVKSENINIETIGLLQNIHCLGPDAELSKENHKLLKDNCIQYLWSNFIFLNGRKTKFLFGIKNQNQPSPVDLTRYNITEDLSKVFVNSSHTFSNLLRGNFKNEKEYEYGKNVFEYWFSGFYNEFLNQTIRLNTK